jgi:hypothetical protein
MMQRTRNKLRVQATDLEAGISGGNEIITI